MEQTAEQVASTQGASRHCCIRDYRVEAATLLA
jgi:hypothetical protein